MSAITISEPAAATLANLAAALLATLSNTTSPWYLKATKTDGKWVVTFDLDTFMAANNIDSTTLDGITVSLFAANFEYDMAVNPNCQARLDITIPNTNLPSPFGNADNTVTLSTVLISDEEQPATANSHNVEGLYDLINSFNWSIERDTAVSKEPGTVVDHVAWIAELARKRGDDIRIHKNVISGVDRTNTNHSKPYVITVIDD